MAKKANKKSGSGAKAPAKKSVKPEKAKAPKAEKTNPARKKNMSHEDYPLYLRLNFEAAGKKIGE